MRHISRKQGGFTLFELILVGLVLSAVLVMSIRAMKENERRTDLAEASEQFSRLYTALVDGWKPHDANSFNNFTVANFINGGFAPEEMVDGATLRHYWRGAVTITPFLTEPAVGVNGAVQVQYQGMMPDNCAGLVSITETRAWRIVINGVVVKDSRPSAGPIPITAVAVRNACDLNSAGNVSWWFG